MQESLGNELNCCNDRSLIYTPQAHLASISSEEENNFLSKILASRNLVGEYSWVGGRRDCKNCERFSWTDGTDWSFQDFENKKYFKKTSRRTPSPRDCVQAGPRWKSASCEEKKIFFCKY